VCDVRGGIQQTLARTGAAVAAGLMLAFAVCVLFDGLPSVTVLPALVALGTTAIAGVALILDRQLRVPARLAGAGAVAVWLVVIPMAPAGPDGAWLMRDRQAVVPGAPGVAAAANSLYASAGSQTVRVGADRLPRSAGAPSAWSIDLGGPRWDVVVIDRGPTAVASASLSRNAGRRVLRRCLGALLRGGRLVIEMPNDSLVEAALEYTDRQTESGDLRAYVLRLRADDDGNGHSDGGTGEYRALVLGRDAAAWILEQARPEGFDVVLHRVRGRQDLYATRLAANLRR
jgi:hypothetical protein